MFNISSASSKLNLLRFRAISAKPVNLSWRIVLLSQVFRRLRQENVRSGVDVVTGCVANTNSSLWIDGKTTGSHPAMAVTESAGFSIAGVF